VDIDFKKVPREVVDELIKTFKYPPTAIIFSGNGYHIYWLFKTPILINGSQEVIDRAEAVGLGLANHFGSDHVQNIDRMLRLPGLANGKYASRPMCQEIFVDGPLYDIADFEEYRTAKLSNPDNRITLGQIDSKLPDKFIALKKDNENVKFIWNTKRPDLNDSSRSGYDMAMCNLLARKKYSPEEIAAVLRQMPSGKGADATESYLEYTISKAIESVDASELETAVFAENALSLLKALDDKSSFSNIETALRTLKESVQGMDTLKRAMVREQAVRILEKIGVSSPAKLVDAAVKDPLAGKSVPTGAMEILMPDPDLSDDEVDGAGLLREIVAVLNRFVVFPPPDSESLADTVALWIFHAHVINAFSVSPFL